MTYRRLIMELEALAMTYTYHSKERDLLICAANVITMLLNNKGRQVG